MVTPRLRLSQITGIDIGLNTTEKDSTQQRYRLVIYCDAQRSPAYVSAVMSSEECTNKQVISLQDLNLETLLPQVARSTEICLRLFSQSTNSGQWKVDIDETVSLKKMRVSAKLPAPPATPICFYVDDIAYVSDKILKNRTSSSHSQAIAALRQSLGRKLPGPVETPSFDLINKILVLQEAKDDAEVSIRASERQVSSMIHGGFTELDEKRQVLQTKLDRTREFIKKVKAEKKEVEAHTHELLRIGNFNSAELHKSMSELRADTQKVKTTDYTVVENIEKQIAAQQSRIATILMDIFPIEPTEQTFHFTICGLQLPSVRAINHFDPIKVGAALGLVAQLVIILSRYLDVPLPYPIRPLGSQSYISDPTSNIPGSRIFPLWTKDALLYRVEYGLYLLHKDIEQLLMAKQLAVVDLKQTLANLKNLMLVISN